MRELLGEAIGLGALLVPLINGIIQALKGLNVETKYLPFISFAIGTGIGAVFGWQLDGNIFVYAVAGFMAGGTASGAYDAVHGLLKGE